MTTTSITSATGNITIDSKALVGFTKESHGLLDKISELNKDFKELVESASDKTGVSKPNISKYFKARFSEKTKEAAALGDLFATLDGILA